MNQTLWRTTVLIALSSVSFFFLSPLAAKVLLHRVDFLETWPLALLALDAFFLGLTVPWAWFVLASGRNPFVPTTILNGLIMLLLCFLLVPRLGVSGIPISSIVAGTLTNHWFAIYTGLGLRRKLVELTVRHVS